MNDKHQILEMAHALLGALSKELRAIESSIENGDRNAGTAIDESLADLRQQWRDASTRLDAVAADKKMDVDDIKSQAAQRWHALQAAIKTYRELSKRRPPVG